MCIQIPIRKVELTNAKHKQKMIYSIYLLKQRKVFIQN